MVLSFDSYAQHQLSGTITSSENKKPVSGVEVYDHQSKSIVTTDASGKYMFKDLEVGVHQITFFSTEYETVTKEINIITDRILDIVIEKLSVELSQIEIAAKKEELFAIRQLEDVEGTSIFAGKKSEVVMLDLIKGNLASNNSIRRK